MKKRWVWAIMICALVGYLLNASVVRSADAYAKDVLRLHILANGNSKEDQRIKLCVRDSVMEYIEENAGEAATKQETANWVRAHLDDIETIAARTVREQGEGYGAKADLGTFEFPSRAYGEAVYPAGAYDALRIKLGAAHGENWWCVIFPPLCLTDLGIQGTAVPEATAPSKATPKAASSPGTDSGASRADTAPGATPSPAKDEVVGGTGSCAYVNGIRLESLFMNWFGN